MTEKTVCFILLLAVFSALVMPGCSGGNKTFELGGQSVTLDKTAKFLDISYPYSSEFEFTNTGHQELVYDLTAGSGDKLFCFNIKYGFMNFGNRQVLEDDIALLTGKEGITELETKEMSFSKKSWTFYSFKQYSEEYGKEIVYHVYYTVHTHISETGFYKFSFENAGDAAELENAIMNSVKFN